MSPFPLCTRLLIAHPQLHQLEILDNVLAVVARALRIQNPAMFGDEHPDETDIVRRARCLALECDTMRSELQDLRIAIVEAWTGPTDDNIPF